jgi:hypothetical protein
VRQKMAGMTIFHVVTVLWPITNVGARSRDLTRRPPRQEQAIFWEREAMNGKLVCGLAICLVSPLFAGCAAAPGVVRAQSPPAACAPGGCDDGCAPNCLPHHEFFYHYVGPEKGCCLEGSCLAGCCLLKNGCCCMQPCCAALPDCLTNRGPLVYPQNPSPGALVQYPYYMCKGPDDFFYPPIGPRP